MLILAGIQLAIALFLGWVLIGYLRHHKVHMPKLLDLRFATVPEGVLIVVPAKDEAETIGHCLEGLVKLTGLESVRIVAVNDRSIDQTEAAMTEVARRYPNQIEVLSIRELPGGWLGKNHACWAGAERGLSAFPQAQYILFTDGDVKFHPQTVAESITWMKGGELDFMTLIEDSEFEGRLEPAYLLLFGIILIFFTARPWLLHKKNGRNFMGNGAYLLASKEAYFQTQGHKALRLEVVEDMRMGLLMRSKGYKCGAAVGLDRIRRRWQPGFVGIFKGLLKNAFAAFEYNLGFALLGMLFFPLVFLGPWICLLAGYPIIGGCSLTMVALCFYLAAKDSHLPWLSSFLLSPFMALAASLNLAASAFRILKDGGVSWRGTLYPLAQLREHCLTVSRAFKS
jgi:glycosyltransferase involved in cell wall biosynthesis